MVGECAPGAGDRRWGGPAPRCKASRSRGFIQADTVVPGAGNPQALNRYAYTLGNPLRYTDPSGHYSEEEIMQAFGVETWDEVLVFFAEGAGGRLENRWGWLEVLRQAQDGDWLYANPWDVTWLNELYQAGAYQIQHNENGEILVGEFEHDLFANHQTEYSLISPKRGEMFFTPYWRQHFCFSIEQHKLTDADTEAVLMDGVSIYVEALGWLSTPVTGGSGPIGASVAQGFLDLYGVHGAYNSLRNIVRFKKNGGFTSDDVFGVAGASPGSGLIVDMVDMWSHSTGWRVRYSP